MSDLKEFVFYVDSIPDWFMDKVSDGTIVLHNCDYKRYSIDEAYCIALQQCGALRGYLRINGGDTIGTNMFGDIRIIERRDRSDK